MTNERWRRRLLLAVLATVGACAHDDQSSDPGPSEEEIEAVQRSYCEIRSACGNLSPEDTIEDCVENLESVYAFTAECFEVRFAFNSCVIDAAADIEANDPSVDVCSALERERPCAEEETMAAIVECNG